MMIPPKLTFFRWLNKFPKRPSKSHINYSYDQSSNHQHNYICFHFSSSSNHTSSINNAIKLLNLSKKKGYTPIELRDAYFTAAKSCHPDSPNAKLDNIHDDEEKQKEHLTNQFHAVSEAYELLQKYPAAIDANDYDTEESSSSLHDYITKSEEEHFRESCREFLGVDAEIVEESKKCPLFREWLKGRTVDAFLWNLFLMKHGGLAPMLRKKKVLNLTEGDGKNSDSNDKRRPRRRRKR